jgi:hypothetical protein
LLVNMKGKSNKTVIVCDNFKDLTVLKSLEWRMEPAPPKLCDFGSVYILRQLFSTTKIVIINYCTCNLFFK